MRVGGGHINEELARTCRRSRKYTVGTEAQAATVETRGERIGRCPASRRNRRAERHVVGRDERTVGDDADVVDADADAFEDRVGAVLDLVLNVVEARRRRGSRQESRRAQRHPGRSDRVHRRELIGVQHADRRVRHVPFLLLQRGDAHREGLLNIVLAQGVRVRSRCRGNAADRRDRSNRPRRWIKTE